MKYKNLGTTGIQISQILMGTWQAGKGRWVGIEDRQSLEAIQCAFEMGITTFDTAEIYGDGHSEMILGQALKEVREKALLCTKVFRNHLKYDQVLEACHNSLKHLGTEYIDLYQIHWPSGILGSEPVPIGETLEALNRLKEEGKIRAIGVSNFTQKQVEEAQKYGSIESVQPPYSLIFRPFERDLNPYCQDQKISILAYSPLAQGLLTGKFGPDHKFDPEDNRSCNKLCEGAHYQRVQEVLKKLRPLADRHGTTLGNLSLAWLLHRPQTHIIVGARNQDQVKQNVRALEVQLSEEEVEEIDSIGRIVTEPLSKDPVMWDMEKMMKLMG